MDLPLLLDRADEFRPTLGVRSQGLYAASCCQPVKPVCMTTTLDRPATRSAKTSTAASCARTGAVGEAIAAEAERLGITQGQLIEQIWELYRTRAET